MNKQVHFIVSYLFKEFYLSVPSIHARRFVRDMERMIMMNGLGYTIKYYKELRLVVTRFISGQPLKVTNRIALDSTGFPKRIQFLKEFVVSGNLFQKRAVMTLLNINRALQLKTDPDYSVITDPYKGTIHDFKIWDNFAEKFVRDFKLYVDRPY